MQPGRPVILNLQYLFIRIMAAKHFRNQQGFKAAILLQELIATDGYSR
jgi:hypothetical protein